MGFRVREFMGLCRGYIGIMENKMETKGYIGLYRGYIGMMDNEMEATIACWGNMGLYRDNGLTGAEEGLGV